MKERLLIFAWFLFLLGAAWAGLWHYLSYEQPYHLEYHDGMTGETAAAAPKKAEVLTVDIGEIFVKSDAVFSGMASGSWPAFRGAGRDNVVNDGLTLTAAPRKVWEIPLGEGYAAPVIADGRVYVLDYDETLAADMLRCFDLADGKELWRRGYRLPLRRNHGKSRTIPAIVGDAVITLGPLGQVMSTHRLTGQLLWSVDLVKDFGTVIPQWYAGQCVLTDGNQVILAPAGPEVLLIAYDAVTGRELWRAPNPGKFTMSHSSVMKYLLDGVMQYVYCGVGGTAGVGPDGKILWVESSWKPPVVAPSPVKIGPDTLFVAAGYAYGGAVIEVKGGRASVLRRWKPDKGVSSEQQTPLVYQDMLFSINPKDSGRDRQLLIGCALADQSLALQVESSRTERFGLGPYLAVNGRFYVVDDDGNLSILALKGKELQRLSKTHILPGHDSWGPLAYTGGLLLARDSNHLVCVDLREDK